MTRRLIIHIDPEDGAVSDFRYDGEAEPPPIISPKIKKRRPEKRDDAEQEQEEEKPS